MDIKTTFLKKKLKEEFFMEVLDSFYGIRTKKVAKILKALYGLCQDLWASYSCLDSYFTEKGW